MKNAIKYYYNLNSDNIHQYKNEYKFKINNKEYILYSHPYTLEEIEEKYQLQIYIKSLGIYCHKIIKNIQNELTTLINNKRYVLIEIQNENRIINGNDISLFLNIQVNPDYFKNINRINWYNLWKNKIDYIEYQISQFGKKYPIIRQSIDYYIGIAENCISLLSNIKTKSTLISCMHNRITPKTTTTDFYNPINFIIDKRVRDIGEYLTNKLYEETDITITINNILTYIYFSNDEIFLLFIRILYPSNYFDICETIIETNTDQDRLMKLLNKIEIYENNIKQIYKYIKKMIAIPEIEWLSKTNQY